MDCPWQYGSLPLWSITAAMWDMTGTAEQLSWLGFRQGLQLGCDSWQCHIHQSITMYHNCHVGHDRDSWPTALVRIQARFTCGMWQLTICNPLITMYYSCHVGHDRDSWPTVLVMIQAAHTNGMWQLTGHHPSITKYSCHVGHSQESWIVVLVMIWTWITTGTWQLRI